MGTDGIWRGKSADAFNASLSYPLGFTWPKRLADLTVTGCEIALGDLTTKPVREVWGTMSAEVLHELVKRTWPDDKRQTCIPPIMPFKILNAKLGSRIIGRYLHEAY
jgi:hypothetical protein